MKKALVTVILAWGMAANAWPQPTQSGQTQGGALTAPKVIRDPSEYNTYMAALNTEDPAARAAAMEAFAKQYPQSVVRTYALEQALAGYQQAGNTAKVEELARGILQIQPDHIPAMAVVVALDRAKAASGDPAALKEGCAYAQTGLQELATWQKPEGVSDADYPNLRDQVANIFNGASGFCALENREYVNARPFYQNALQIDPASLQDNYQLAIAYLASDPIEATGFWYAAKALSLAGHNATAANAMGAYIKAKYKKYHGKVDDWDQFAATVASQTSPPPPAELAKLISSAACGLAVKAVKDYEIENLSFSDEEFILSQAGCSPANKDAADKVWQHIQDLQKNGEARLKIPFVKVIASTGDTIDAAITEDNQRANKPDVHVVMQEPMLHPPAAGTTTDILGVLTNYTLEPFMFTLVKGELLQPKPLPSPH